MIRLAAWIIAGPFIVKAVLFAFFFLVAALEQGCIITTTDLRPANIRLAITTTPEEAPDEPQEE